MAEEPWDELMGPPPQREHKAVALDDDRTMSETTISSVASSTVSRMPSRWAQYEDDEQLRHDSHEANCKAIELAAEKIANSPPRSDFSAAPSSRSSVGSRRVTSPVDYDSDGSEPASWETDEAIRAEALKMLEIADDHLNTSYSVRKTQTGGFSASYSGGFGGGAGSSRGSSRRSSGSSFSGSGHQKRVPRALAGIDFSKRASTSRLSYTTSPRNSYSANDDSPYSEQEGLVDVIEMENHGTVPKKETKWSSRYSIDHTLLALSGGRSRSSNPRDVLDELERETDREIRSARNMFVSSPHDTPRIFGAASYFGGKLNPEQTTPINRTTNIKSWMDTTSGLDTNGKSLTPPEPRKTWQEQVERKKRQQRRLALVVLGICAFILVVAGVAVSRKGSDSKASAFGDSGVDRGVPEVVFYVTSDSPYDSSEEQKLTADLRVISDAEFVVHLGNIQDSSVTLCSEARYSRVKDVLLQSPVPIFILPGEEDWNNCPNPENAWETWENTFSAFESNFDHSFMVSRQLRRKENFAFLHQDVLFMGFHLVGGRNDVDESEQRLLDNINWMESVVTMNEGKFKSIVMLGNARPGPQQRMFFDRLSDFLGPYDLPIIYVHANSGVGGVMQYDLFGNQGIEALQIEDGGKNPPLRISVYEGDGPFVVG